MKKTLLFLLLFIFITGISNASHIIGYDLCLINIKAPNGAPTNNYKVRFKFFRDMTGIPLNTLYNFEVKKNSDNSTVMTIPTPKINPPGTPLTYQDGDCAPPGFSGQRIEFGLYESANVDLSTLTDPGGYYLSAVEGSRNPGIVNTEGGPGGSSAYSITYTMDLPRLNALSPYKYNSSPEFKKTPLTYFCVGKPYTIDWDIEDPDGDSLVFSMAQPLDGGGEKPWSANLINYAPGYNLYYNIADGAPDLSIDSRTGIINFIPTKAAKYLVAFKCEEYRNGVRIGEVRREFQMETVACNDAPPVTEDNDNRSRYITDTIYFGDNSFSLQFTSRDALTDSLTMEYLQIRGDNLINQGARFNAPGDPVNLNRFKIEEIGVVQGVFKWVPGCEDIRPQPYRFDVVVHDRTCPSPFYDTTYVTLYVKSKTNYSPFFVSPDTFENRHTLTYFIQAGNTFELNGATLLKAVDTNQFAQTIVMLAEVDPDDTSNFRNEYTFVPSPGTLSATGTFSWTPDCQKSRPEPYKIKFLAYDDDCFPDTAELNVELYVIPAYNETPVMEVLGTTHPFVNDSVTILENQLLAFRVKAVDTLNLDSNRYRNLTVGVFNGDYSSFIVPGGATLNFRDSTGVDSAFSTFQWTPNCANVREEPYRLRLFAYDDGCPDSLFMYREIKIRVLGPVNTAPYFPKAPVTHLIKDTIEAGKIFSYEVYALDTNARFDSIAIAGSGDMFTPATVAQIAYFTPVIPPDGLPDSAKTTMDWQTTCQDIRPAPYVSYLIAADNACGNPAKDTLEFQIWVVEKPNVIPQFTSSSIPVIDTTIYAGELIEFDLESRDLDTLDIITIDTVYSSVPQGMTRPQIQRVQGKKEIGTTLSWNTDCSNIGGPYTIKVGTWDDACRVIADSSSVIYQVRVVPNPSFKPSLNITDTALTVVAGETYHFGIESTNGNPKATDSILISSTGEIFANLPGEAASLVQKTVSGVATADLDWKTSCEQIRPEPYKFKLYVSNSACQVSDTVDIEITVVPNTDVTEELPNTFTPNEDGVNDVYTIKKEYKVYCDPEFTFRIFNRWGKKVFETRDPLFEWSGEGLSEGTYFYTITSRARTQTGTLNLIR